MARITQYQQNQLASPVVGTPMVDNSVANTLGMISQQAAGIGNDVAATSRALFDSGLQERRRKEAELRAYNKQLANAQREAEVAEKVSIADVEYTDASLKVRNEKAWDTQGALNDFSIAANQTRQRLIEGESDPLKKAELQKALTQRQTTYQDTLARWAESRQVPMIDSSIEKTAGALSLQLGNAALPAAEMGQKIQLYKQDNAKNYAFRYGPEGVKKMQEDTESGVLNWLAATALNTPNQLEARIDSVSHGQLVEKGKLLKFASEQRRIANEIKVQQHAQDQQERMAAQLNAWQTVMSSTTTGDYKDASPQVVDQVVKQYGGKLSPEQNVRLQQISKQAATKAQKDAEKQISLKGEQSVVANFGTFSAQESQLAAKVQAQIAQFSNRKIPIKQRMELIGGIQNTVDQYQDAYLNLNAIKNSITNKNLKGIANLQVIAAKERFGAIVDKLSGTPQANEARQVKNTLYSAVTPTSLFPDAKRNAVYQYIYQNSFYEKLQKMKMDSKMMQKLADDPRAVKALRNYLHTQTYQQMRNMGVAE